ncbi:MAG: DUF262 domain-containing protein [Clostridiales bacterium]|nr:DUF262 domain-containing protein [Clostridiales bacterium]
MLHFWKCFRKGWYKDVEGQTENQKQEATVGRQVSDQDIAYRKKRNHKQDNEIKEYLKQSEKYEEEYTGIEAAPEDDVEEPGIRDGEFPYNVKDIRIDQKMITAFQIEHWINHGELDLQPDFQRNLVWDVQRKTALIESMMMRIPIPAFYLSEESDGKKYVIDGLQRFSAIHEFMTDGYQLKKMQYLKSCEKKSFNQLDKKFRTYIEDTILYVNILDERCPQMVKFDVFRRVNTGGIPLNPQEIRNIMAAPGVRKLLKSMAGCEEFLRVTNNRIRDIRMGAQQLCLRFLTVYDIYDWDQHVLNDYHGLLRMMDAKILSLNAQQPDILIHLLEEFKRIMSQCEIVLGKESFCKPGSKVINKSIFTAWSVVLANVHIDRAKLESSSEILKRKYHSLLKDYKFYNSITSSTGTRSNIEISIEGIRGIVEEIL